MCSESKHVNINLVLERKRKHINKLVNGNAENHIIKTWTKHYDKMLKKYGFEEVNMYESSLQDDEY